MPWLSGASEVKFWKTAVYSQPISLKHIHLHGSKSAFLFMVRKETIRVIISRYLNCVTYKKEKQCSVLGKRYIDESLEEYIWQLYKR